MKQKIFCANLRKTRKACVVITFPPDGGKGLTGWWAICRTARAGRFFVRLTGPTSGPGARGKWQDSATSEYGDLLDIIRARTGITRFPELLDEARAHLGRPQPVVPNAPVPRKSKAPGGTPAAAARLFAASMPVAGTLADSYLRARGLTQGGRMSALRFHPKCWHRDEGQTKSTPRPALIAAVTDGAGALQGVHRTWLALDGKGKAAVKTQRRALYGSPFWANAVRLTPP